VVAVAEDPAASAHQRVQPAGDSDGKALDGAPEVFAVDGFDDQMDVVP
jgi:hypothetical protein